MPDITQWEVEAALRNMTNGTATGNDRINIKELKAREATISKIEYGITDRDCVLPPGNPTKENIYRKTGEMVERRTR